MTLVEIMISISIFLVVSTAMLGVMSAASSLYRQGERSRAANDEVMAVLNILDRDLARVISRDQGGHFWAWCVDPRPAADRDADGNCIAAWVIEDDDSSTGYSMVAWGVQGTAPAAQLRRACFREIVPFDLDTYPDDKTLKTLSGGGANTQDLVDGVLHFGVWLLCTSRSPAEPHVRPRDDFWIEAVDTSNTLFQHTEPQRDFLPYSTFDGHRYPLVVRFTLMLTGRGTQVQDGRVLADDGETALRVGGLNNVPVLRGTLARIGTELVGFQGLTGGRLKINTTLDEGPLFDQDPADRSGRGVYRSTAPGAPGHPTGTKVFLGHQISLVRQLPGDPLE